MTSFKRFESKPVVKIIYTYTHCNLWRHQQFITIFYKFLHIRIEIIHGSHMYILFLPRIGLYVSFLPLAYARGKTLWHKGLLPVVKTIYTNGFHYYFLIKCLLYLFSFFSFLSDILTSNDTTVWGHFRVHIFNRPISVELTKYYRYQTRVHAKSCCQIGQYFNCLAYDWMVKYKGMIYTWHDPIHDVVDC